MSLKEKILNQNKEACCKRCINFELLNDSVPYCNNSDKLILPEHVEIIRKCERYKMKAKGE